MPEGGQIAVEYPGGMARSKLSLPMTPYAAARTSAATQEWSNVRAGKAIFTMCSLYTRTILGET
jgi:hypothetical protein